MSRRFSGIIKNIGYSFSANLLSLMISFVIAMVVPKALGIEEYGYWQLYVFYLSFVGFFHFGLVGGIYLRYGGMEYTELDKPLLHSQYIIVMVIQFVASLLICTTSFFIIKNPNRAFIMISIGINCILINSRAVLLYILQATGRIKESAKNAIVEKVIYASIILTIILVLGIRNFRYLILADLIAKCFTFLTIAYTCKDIVISQGIALRNSLMEACTNISVGIKMLFSDIAGNLILGIVRLFIEKTWDVSTFGKVSLSLYISNLMMIFIGAVGIVMFPVLKRMNHENRGIIYKKLHILLVVPILGIMIVFQPARWLFLLWLPKYADSAVYLVLLFPLCLFEGKVHALSNNYLKVLRLEKTMMYINIFSMVVSVVVSVLCASVLKSLFLCVLSILLLSAFRCVLSEIIISKELNINIFCDIIYEFVLVIIFVASGWVLNGWASILIYVVAYVVYLFIQRNNICDVIRFVFER